MSDDKIKLLIVDDEERFLTTLAKRLELRDFEVTPVTSGEAALEKAREKPFDIALLDLKMPGMQGEEVLEALKRDHPHLEVIILTGHGSVDSAVECLKSGSYHYLQKPCEMDDLVTVLKDAYMVRVRKKLELDEERFALMHGFSDGEPPMAILRRLKELDKTGR
jgi:DNA-binding NtrC family response regulator